MKEHMWSTWELLGVLLFGMFFGCLAGGNFGLICERRQAIEHGAASYVCDPTTGETEFRWKEQSK